jgi:short subunit dehydrogenase-like uncharacterized protein
MTKISSNNNNNKKYDLILFGVTGFTGKLAAEYLLANKSSTTLRWAVCARSESKARAVLDDIRKSLDNDNNNNVGKEVNKTLQLPDILVADLVGTSPADKETLQAVVAQTRVVITCAGPFERYGRALVECCADLGVHYADVTGETDFCRQCVTEFDSKAQASGAKIVHHCGNDCIPQDLTVFEMNVYAREHDCELVSVNTFVEMPEDASFSGGTVATATFQLNKDRSSNSENKPAFDPLLMTPDGTKSEYTTTNASPKTTIDVPELDGCKAGPWIMGPVMVNCVRRSK